eukprot:CAMPEP_0173149420 /NCGR_PEP_ID=MMETSP1105-20130129/10318_1 /TAXON_ID=2985 /ORGANISM="Ochromonas sp., Strain BG-1" /LENGTH=188 /DNA_ID=CAMNT_0014064289 /DNA_START=146 /DNA_END=712 /DNA_ORIENTATION=-
MATMSPFRNTQKLFRVVSIGGLVVSLLPTPVQAARMDGNPNNEGEKSNTKKNDGEAFDFEKLLASQLAEGGTLNGVKRLFESGVPSQFGYGFLMGYSSGFCLKKVSRVAAFLLGSTFILIQSLSYSGLIKVDYEGVQEKIEQLLDLNKDGKVDMDDVKYAQNKIIDVLEYNMPAGGGFSAGLIAGFRS